MDTSNKHTNTFMIIFIVLILLGFIYFFWIDQDRPILDNEANVANTTDQIVQLNDYSKSILRLKNRDILSVSQPERRTVQVAAKDNKPIDHLPEKTISILTVTTTSKEHLAQDEIKKQTFLYTDHAIAIKDYKKLNELIPTKSPQE